MDLLRFITCGSVDDGKSTLIGRLLHDCAALTDEQQAALGSAPDFAELLGMDEVAQLMSDILDQEEAADELLSDIAEDRANPMAAGEEPDEE